MTTDTIFRKHFQRLERAFPWVTLEKETLRIYFEKLSRFDEDVLMQTIDVLIDTQKGMPPPSVCLAVADSILFNKIREKETEERKMKERAARLNAAEMSREGFRLIEDYFSGKITRREYVEGNEAIGIPMGPLKEFYRERNLDLDDYALQANRKKGKDET